MSIKNLLYWSYWFNQPSALKGTALVVWLVLFFALILAGIIALCIRAVQRGNAERKLFSRYGSLGIWMGLTGFIWLFFRQQEIIFLSSRFWLVLWATVFVWWLIKLLRYTLVRLPAVRREHLARAARDPYLPTKS